MNKSYSKLFDFLMEINSGRELIESFDETWLVELIPGIEKLKGCDQGKNNHLEGDVAVHTGLVYDNLISTAKKRLSRSPDFIERLSVVLHDVAKPDIRVDLNGNVYFPQHEKLAAEKSVNLGREIGLDFNESARLEFVVEQHGNAHSFLNLSQEIQAEILDSPYIISLALLQEADALSCIKSEGKHLPVFWKEMTDGCDYFRLF